MTEPEYIFIGGCPRSGTSLLSSLVGNLDGVGVIQDLTAIYQLKRAALYVMFTTNGIPLSQVNLHILNQIPRIDLRQTEFFPNFLESTLVDCLNSFNGINGRVLRAFLNAMDIFLFRDFNVHDPRKDRRQGALYLQGLCFDEFLNSDNMSACMLSLLRQSARSLSNIQSSGQNFSVICDKTPENLAGIDVISMITSNTGFKFIHLVRDPVAVFGARKQRAPSSAEEFVKFFRTYAVPTISLSSAALSSCVRYEDIISKPNEELNRIISELDLKNKIRAPLDVGNRINPGKYSKYVGTSINKSRDAANRSLVSDEEKLQIYSSLSDYCQKYSYGPYAPCQ